MRQEIAPPGFTDEETPLPLSPIDLLGTMVGTAFLSGSVALAVMVDRREAAKEGQFPWAEAPASSSAPILVSRKLRLVTGTDR